MPVGAGSIKRAATTAAIKPETEKKENVKTKVQKNEVKPAAENPQKKSTAAAKAKVETKTKTASAKKSAKQLKLSTTQNQPKGPDRLGNQIYHITDELPVHLL